MAPVMSEHAPIVITRRRARESDVPFLVELRLQTIAPHFLAAGAEHSLAEQETRVRARFDCAEILESAGQAIGLLKVLRESPQWQLVQVQLMPSFQGQGIGGRLVASVVREAGAAGVPVVLSVLKANPARQLYERLGFKVIAEVEDAFHMQAGG